MLSLFFLLNPLLSYNLIEPPTSAAAFMVEYHYKRRLVAAATSKERQPCALS